MFRKNIPFIHSSTISDPEGRFLIVSGSLNSVPITLVNVYRSNFDNPLFFQKVFNSIPNFSDNIVIDGDFVQSILSWINNLQKRSNNQTLAFA